MKHQRLIIILLTVFSTIKLSALVLPQEQQISPPPFPYKFVPYEPELYNLAYDVFLANRNLVNAFALTQAAVRQQPDSILWRKRLAQVSLWSGYPNISLDQWMAIVQLTDDPEAEKQAIKLAMLLYNYHDALTLYQRQLHQGIAIGDIWQELTTAFINTGEPEQALALLKKQASHLPVNQRLYELAFSLGDNETALAALKRLEKKQGGSLKNALAQSEILVILNQHAQALMILKNARRYAKPTDKPYWELLGDLAWQSSNHSLALTAYEHLYALSQDQPLIMQRLAYLLRAQHPEHSWRVDIDIWRRYPRLDNLLTALYSSYDNKQWHWFYYLFTQLPMQQQQEQAALLIEWALWHHHYPLALFTRAYVNPSSLPVCLQLSLALHSHDTQKTIALITNKNTLSDGDRSYAAHQIGQIKLAQQWAYRALEKAPNNTEHAQHFKEISLPYADQMATTTRYRKNGAVEGIESAFNVRHFFSSSVYLQPFASRWFIRATDPQQLIHLPAAESRYGTLLHLDGAHTESTLTLDQREAVRHFFQASLFLEQQWNRRWRNTLNIGWQQTSDEDALLLLSAKKNQVALDTHYQLTMRDTLSFDIREDKYNAQDDVFLGNGQNYQLSWLHQFYFTYPHWQINAYTGIHQYQASHNHSALLASISPVPITDPLPQNFKDLGLTLGFGQQYPDDYTHAFRLFGEAGLVYHSRNGMGQLGTLGIAGSVFGRDNLALSAQVARNEAANTELDAIIELQYRLYWS